MKENFIPQVKSDILFHDLFNENEMDTLEWLVMQVLECKYEDIHGKVKVKNIRLTRTNKKERSKYVDLIVEYKNEKIIIELNNNFNGINVRNFLFGVNQLLNNYQLNNGNYYKDLTRVIVLNLNWFKFKKKEMIEPKCIQEISYSIFKKDGYLFKLININLDYYSELRYNQVDMKDKLYKLLTLKNEDELNLFCKEEKLLKSYNKKLIDLSRNDDYMEDIMDEEIEKFVEKHTNYQTGLREGIEQGIDQGIEKGISQGISQGINQGIKKEKNFIVTNMYNKKYKLKDIAEITNLTIEEVESIINKK